jgi:hypothetical protein
MALEIDDTIQSWLDDGHHRVVEYASKMAAGIGNFRKGSPRLGVFA